MNRHLVTLTSTPGIDGNDVLSMGEQLKSMQAGLGDSA